MILYNSDNVLRNWKNETTAAGLWLKLESLYDEIADKSNLLESEIVWF